MRNKGFTLIELLGVVIILAIIVIIAVPAVVNSNKKSNEQEYKRFLENVYMATESYIQVNEGVCPNLGSQLSNCIVSVSDLISKGYIKSDVEDPSTGYKIGEYSYVVNVSVKNNGTLEYYLEIKD